MTFEVHPTSAFMMGSKQLDISRSFHDIFLIDYAFCLWKHLGSLAKPRFPKRVESGQGAKLGMLR